MEVGRLRDAALAAGAEQRNEGGLEPAEAIRRFGRCATRELELLSEKPQTELEFQLWEMARQGELKPVRALIGTLWDLA